MQVFHHLKQINQFFLNKQIDLETNNWLTKITDKQYM